SIWDRYVVYIIMFVRLGGSVVEPLLRIDNLYGGYTHKHVLHGVSFKVRPGEIIGLIGLNGAGKSTVLKHIIGLMQPKKGSIAVKVKTCRYNPVTYRSQMDYIPEMPVLYDELTLSEHLRLTAMVYNIPNEFLEKRLPILLNDFLLEK